MTVRRRTRRFRWLLACLAANLGIGCTLNVAAPSTVTFTPSPTITPALTPTQPAYYECGWQWARQNALPEWATRLQENLAATGLTAASVRVELYGENCLDRSGAVRYFAAMTTDFYLTVPASGWSEDDMAGVVAKAEAAIRALDTQTLPARPGYLDIVFDRDGQAMRFRVLLTDLEAAIAGGLTGAALLEALGGLR